MQNKMVKRIMVALMCGTLVAGSVSVSAFAGEGSYISEDANKSYRGVRIAQPEHGRIEVTGLYNRVAECDDTLTVKLIPDEGYVVAPVFNQNLYATYSFTTGTHADQSIKAVEGKENVYTFVMPWCDMDGIEISANFVPAK